MKNKFDLQAQLEGIYARYPEASPMPVIGITGRGIANACHWYHG